METSNNRIIWMSALRQREAAGDKQIRNTLIKELEKHAGLPESMAKAALRGQYIHSDRVNEIVSRSLELPDPKAMRACGECS